MESQMELRWSSDGSKGSQDGISAGTQTEAKEAKEAKESKMESQLELRRKRRKPRLTPKIESN